MRCTAFMLAVAFCFVPAVSPVQPEWKPPEGNRLRNSVQHIAQVRLNATCDLLHQLERLYTYAGVLYYCAAWSMARVVYAMRSSQKHASRPVHGESLQYDGLSDRQTEAVKDAARKAGLSRSAAVETRKLLKQTQGFVNDSSEVVELEETGKNVNFFSSCPYNRTRHPKDAFQAAMAMYRRSSPLSFRLTNNELSHIPDKIKKLEEKIRSCLAASRAALETLPAAEKISIDVFTSEEKNTCEAMKSRAQKASMRGASGEFGYCDAYFAMLSAGALCGDNRDVHRTTGGGRVNGGTHSAVQGRLVFLDGVIVEVGGEDDDAMNHAVEHFTEVTQKRNLATWLLAGVIPLLLLLLVAVGFLIVRRRQRATKELI
ncbi:hypothetical protein TRVL_03292 [Trypanosoma vivax]|uniref:Uncharacterized protein n=1 Tax=Trypanosoma vivax (strain Y486) TaxID=1055687 RepID=G0TZT8_TRYVY|nr:hypothetical protein TRVL_03292 [Trypanosoma vivax]CCC50116.1 hypothetical protein, conserved in T. vivax [Trypanosoma vivax Y486]